MDVDEGQGVEAVETEAGEGVGGELESEGADEGNVGSVARGDESSGDERPEPPREVQDPAVGVTLGVVVSV